jgi:hypothetical protein
VLRYASISNDMHDYIFYLSFLYNPNTEEAVGAAKAEFEAMVNMTNQVDDVVVRIVGTTVHVHKLSVQVTDISKDMLRDLLADVCGAFYRAGLLQKLFPPQNWYIEALHLAQRI